MNKINRFTGLFAGLIFLFSLAFTATATMLIPASEQAKDHAKAPDKSPVISEDWELERVDFVHYVKPENPGKPEKLPKTDPCYKLMGVKWKSLPVNYSINPTNPDNLSSDFVINTIVNSVETWDNSTSNELFNDTYSIDSSAQFGVFDSNNAIVFGAYPEENAIAVTSVWYTRKGKQIVEFDMIFNTNFSWGDGEQNPALMDLQNIATHEFGHSVGLSDIYTDTCSTVTMYGYSFNGDIIKRTLEEPDILGIQKMYGE